jgi:hypothetical protein
VFVIIKIKNQRRTQDISKLSEVLLLFMLSATRGLQARQKLVRFYPLKDPSHQITVVLPGSYMVEKTELTEL